MTGPDDTIETPAEKGGLLAGTDGIPGPCGDAGAVVVPEEGDGPALGWPRAIATGLVIIVAVFAGAVLGANAILTKSLALTRTAREWLATALFLVVIALAAVVLRRLQARGLI